MSEPAADHFVVQREFDAPREAVWRAFTDPDQFARWFGPDGLVVPRESLTLEARTGGHASYVLQAVDGPQRHHAGAVFTQVVPGELLVAEEVFEMDGLGAVVLHSRIELADAGSGRTRIRITQGGHGGQAHGARAAWESSLDKLAALLTGG